MGEFESNLIQRQDRKEAGAKTSRSDSHENAGTSLSAVQTWLHCCRSNNKT